mmetsp:Transcript_33108/g.55464  ORF Transcript_33108/g.55464 Transcript_33108/m.55464 type:complete len:396 (+) Transcript_33108:113-1300(+)|eukprot:CAMPEP_0198204930 /NCGR_PEP_ID=MMETSP1445-20131203/8417_1 /TAXON_ID=36898 /ORGANISM="Pyramimonas sp., Strain CCMP2087" /LENGTH=395 /DNA_ID=CAMNT_0043877029 /DNA_START=113 /DNA_END=1297 /DNA_ORIENTATION=-
MSRFLRRLGLGYRLGELGQPAEAVVEEFISLEEVGEEYISLEVEFVDNSVGERTQPTVPTVPTAAQTTTNPMLEEYIPLDKDSDEKEPHRESCATGNVDPSVDPVEELTHPDASGRASQLQAGGVNSTTSGLRSDVVNATASEPVGAGSEPSSAHKLLQLSGRSRPSLLQPTEILEPKFMQAIRQQAEATSQEEGIKEEEAAGSKKRPKDKRKDKVIYQPSKSRRLESPEHSENVKETFRERPKARRLESTASKSSSYREQTAADHDFSQGYVFHCNYHTMEECFQRNLFGSSKNDWHTLKNIDWESTAVFLFNVSDKTLHGVFVCSSVGLDLVPDAWRGRFPAQAVVRVWAECEPLHISKFAHCLNSKKAGMLPLVLQRFEVSRILELMQLRRW